MFTRVAVPLVRYVYLRIVLGLTYDVLFKQLTGMASPWLYRGLSNRRSCDETAVTSAM